MATRGFVGRGSSDSTGRIPPGQYEETGFPVLSAGPTPKTPLSKWTFKIEHDGNELSSWTWEEMLKLPESDITTDIHCVTKWSKLNTRWKGVTIETFLEKRRDRSAGGLCHGLL